MLLTREGGTRRCDRRLPPGDPARPDFAEAHHNLGVALTKRWALDDAVAAYRRAIELKPDFPEALDQSGQHTARPG